MKFKDLVKRIERLESIVGDKNAKDKITLDDFFSMEKGKVCIHCDTREKASKLLSEFDKLGKYWFVGDSYLVKDYWSCYEDKTCYTNDGCYCGVFSAEKNSFKVYEFEDIVFPIEQEKPKWTFTEDEKVVLRMVDERFKWIARNKFGGIELFRYKPYKYGEMWMNEFVTFDDLTVLKKFFKTIKWEDDEPCEFRKYI